MPKPAEIIDLLDQKLNENRKTPPMRRDTSSLKFLVFQGFGESIKVVAFNQLV